MKIYVAENSNEHGSSRLLFIDGEQDGGGRTLGEVATRIRTKLDLPEEAELRFEPQYDSAVAEALEEPLGWIVTYTSQEQAA